MMLFASSIFSQSKLKRDIMEAKQLLIVNGYSIEGISNDSIIAVADSLQVVTQYAMKKYVDANGGNGGFVADGITITPQGVVDTSLIATQYDLTQKIDKNTITRTFYNIDSTYVFTVNDNYENDILTSVDTILRQCDGCDLGSNNSAIKIIDGGYSILRELPSDTIADQFYINDWESLDWKGNSLPCKGGIFVKVLNGVENGSTLIVSADGQRYARVWDGINGRVEWFEGKGYDQNGNAFSNSNEVAGGIFTEGDRIKGILSIAVNVEFENRVYTNDITNYIEANQGLFGNGTTIKKRDAVVTTLTSSISIGNTIINVADASNFRIGDEILGITGTNHGQNSGVNRPHIVAISGNTITVQSAFTKAVSSGSQIVTRCRIFSTLTGTDNGNVKIFNIDFDGNRANNNHNYDWTYNDILSLLNGFFTIGNCKFYESSAETIFIGNGHIFNSHFYDLNGSAIHGNGTHKNGQLLVENCSFLNTNEITDVVLVHSEGVITISSEVRNWTINKCRFLGGAEGVIGQMDSDDNNFTFMNNECQNYKSIINIQQSTNNDTTANFSFVNNVFRTCGRFRVTGLDNIGAGGSIKNVNIIGNIFSNTTFDFKSITNFEILGNTIETNIGEHGFTSYPSTILFSHMSLINCDKVRIESNSFEVDTLFNLNVRCGLLFWDLNTAANANVVRKVDGVDTEYSYSQDIKVHDNTFRGYWRTLGNISNTLDWNFYGEVEKVGWSYTDNHIYMSNYVGNGTDGWGMQVAPGVIAEGNNIYEGQHTAANIYPIVAVGIVAGSSRETRLRGPYVQRNTVIGNSKSIFIPPNNRYSCFLLHNTIPVAESGSTGNSYLNNFLIDSSNLPSLTAPVIPKSAFVEEDKGDY